MERLGGRTRSRFYRLLCAIYDGGDSIMKVRTRNKLDALEELNKKYNKTLTVLEDSITASSTLAYLTDEAIHSIVLKELDDAIEMAMDEKAPNYWEDDALLRSLHVVRAYFSVPGTYMEGAYDGS